MFNKMDKETARRLVLEWVDNQSEAPAFISFWDSYGCMAEVRTHLKIENNEIHYYGYKFHILPTGQRVADARGWKSVKEPQIIGWDKISNIEDAKDKIYHA